MRSQSPGMIVILNGTSSAGKTSIAQALQQQANEPFVYLGVDFVIHAVPLRFLGAETLGGINSVFGRLASGFHHTIAAFAVTGNNVIVDHVLQEEAMRHNILRLYKSVFSTAVISLSSSSGHRATSYQPPVLVFRQNHQPPATNRQL